MLIQNLWHGEKVAFKYHCEFCTVEICVINVMIESKTTTKKWWENPIKVVLALLALSLPKFSIPASTFAATSQTSSHPGFTEVVHHLKQCYNFCNIPGIDHHFHIVTKKLLFFQPPAIILDSGCHVTDFPERLLNQMPNTKITAQSTLWNKSYPLLELCPWTLLRFISSNHGW